MKICIVENEQPSVDHLLTLLQKWEATNDIHLEIDCFSSGEAFLVKKTFDYHIIFLDIQLEKITGIEVAQNLREQNYRNELVFLTAYQEYVFEGYNLHALNYILKPAAYEQLDACLSYVKENLNDSCFVHKYRNDVTKIPYSSILYLSSHNQYTEIVTAKEIFRQAESLKNMSKILPRQFVQCHRTLIVNVHYIVKIKGKEIYLSNGEKLPISATYFDSVKNAFLQSLNFRKDKP